MILLATARLYLLFVIAGIWINKHNESKETGIEPAWYWRYSGYAYGVFFIVQDCFFDLIFGSIWFWRLPEYSKRGPTFTARLKLIKDTEQPWTWRYRLAYKFCELLNKVDEDHC